MKVSRRTFVTGATLATTFGAQAQQAYPERQITAICNFLAGTGGDTFVRFFGEKLSAILGKPVIVDNRGGALGNIGTEAAAKSKPDGYTILIAPGSSTMAAAQSVFKKLPFDPIKDFIPITTLSKLAFVITVDAKSPVKTLAELTAALKAKGDKATYGAAANTGLVTGELYKRGAGLAAVQVAQYRDMQTPLNDLYAGQIDFLTADIPWAVELAKSGKIRILATSSDTRATALPDVPTMVEAGIKDFGSLTAWWGVWVAAGTPKPITDRLEAAFNQVTASDDVKKWLNGLGSDVFPGNSKMLAELLVSETKNWAEYVRLAKIEPQ